MPKAEGDRAPLVRPEPAPAERRAIERALAEARKQAEAPARTAWWRAGVRENAVEPSLDSPD